MTYRNLEECIIDLEKHGHLIRIHEEVDPLLEMAAIHLKVYEAGGPALLFEMSKARSTVRCRTSSGPSSAASLYSGIPGILRRMSSRCAMIR